MSALPESIEIAKERTVAKLIASEVHQTRLLPEGTLIAARYRVRTLVGEGGMSVVYLGHDERLGRDVAIKVLNPATSDPQPPLREERVSSTLIHNNVVSIFDAGEIPEDHPGGGRTFIVMQHVPGTTAHEIAPVPVGRALDIVRQACEGLAAAHERGIVHCDVKPSNLLIEPSGRVLVADFGVAASVETDVGDFIHGSPAYIAPERLHGARPTPRFDVYGLGGVLTFLITGQKPTTDVTPDLPPGCPAWFREVVTKARHPEPKMRYSNAREMAIALDQARSHSSDRTEDRFIGEEPTKVIRPSAASAPAVSNESPPPVRRVDRVHTPRPTRVVRASSAPAAPRSRGPMASGTIEMPSPFGDVPQPRREVARPVVASSPARTYSASGPIGRFGTILALIAAMVASLIVGGMLFGGSGGETSSAAGSIPLNAMPELRGQTFGEAVHILGEQGLAVDRIEIVYDPASLNEVIVQYPEAGGDVTQEDEIVLIVRSRQ